jgi:hypothetical protein
MRWQMIGSRSRRFDHTCNSIAAPASDQQIFDILRQLRGDRFIEIMKVPGQPEDVFETQPHACWFGMTDVGPAQWDSEGAKYRDDEPV